jgi:nucleotide-binding universal stress UspA family protein
LREIVIGTVGDDGSRDAVALGLALARSVGARPVVVHVRPERWPAPGSGRVDAEWDAFLETSAAETVARTVEEQAEAFAGLEAATDIGRHRSSGSGLDEVAARRGSGAIVIGSAPGGPAGRIRSGSTADKLLHGAGVVVALAPAGYRVHAPERITRVVVAIESGSEDTQVRPVVELVGRHGIDLDLLTVVRRATRVYSRQLGPDAEAELLAALREQAEGSLDRAAALARELGIGVRGRHVVVGDEVDDALAAFDWRSGDVLAVGSSRSGVIRRVLLGDMTFRLVRAAPVPVLVVPRG